MSARLSRRFGNIGSLQAMRARLSLAEVYELDHLALGRKTEFEDLPERYQQAILEVEREVYGDEAMEIVAQRFGPPQTKPARRQSAAA